MKFSLVAMIGILTVAANAAPPPVENDTVYYYDGYGHLLDLGLLRRDEDVVARGAVYGCSGNSLLNLKRDEDVTKRNLGDALAGLVEDVDTTLGKLLAALGLKAKRDNAEAVAKRDLGDDLAGLVKDLDTTVGKLLAALGLKAKRDTNSTITDAVAEAKEEAENEYANELEAEAEKLKSSLKRHTEAASKRDGIYYGEDGSLLDLGLLKREQQGGVYCSNGNLSGLSL